MKIAIVHNSLDAIGGAEKITLILAKELNADIYTTNIDKKNIKAMGFDTTNIFSIGKIPKEQPYKHTIAFWKFSKLQLKNYDTIIICGDWGISTTNKNKNCIWYCHSPARELFDLYNYTKQHSINMWQRPLFTIWATYHKQKFIKYAKLCKKVLCNSNNTKQRLKTYLKINAKIVHPGINTKIYKNKPAKNYWLSVNRLINHKQIQMQLDVFKETPKEKLIIVGCSERARHFCAYKKQLDIPQNVQIKQHISNNELIRLYSECKGFIATSKNEDFGLAPIEAMASGKPVVALSDGGYKETILHKKTGFLAKNKEEIIKYMSKIKKIKKEDCIQQAKKFDTKIFLKKIKQILSQA